MIVRMAAIEDAKDIARIQIDSWRFAYRGIMEGEVLASLNLDGKTYIWESILTAADSPAFVAVNKSGRIDGFIHLGACRDDDLTGKNVGEVTAIYVNPDVIGNGVGTVLLSEGLRHLEDLGYSKVVLWVLEKNKLAIRFYKKFGFGPDGREKKHPETGLVELRYNFSDAPN